METNKKISPYEIEGGASSRILHFFWLLDVSGSMAGKKIETLNWAIKEVIPELENIEDTERIKIKMRAIAFDEDAWWHVGPEAVSLEEFFNQWKDLEAGSITETQLAIDMLAEALDVEKMGKRNVPPVAILISDGYCTADEGEYEASINRLNSIPWGKKAVRLSIGISSGNGIDYDKDELDLFISPYLRNGNEQVETLHADNPQKLLRYIKVASTTASVSASRSSTDTFEEKAKPVDIKPEALNDSVSITDELTIDDADEVF